jgi:hypothetical protein
MFLLKVTQQLQSACGLGLVGLLGRQDWWRGVQLLVLVRP